MGAYYFTCNIDGGFEKEHSSGDPRNPCPLCRIAELEVVLLETQRLYREQLEFSQSMVKDVKDLRAENQRLLDRNAALIRENTAKRELILRLREAAEEYSYNRHFPDCKIHRPAIGVCNCGYDELMAALGRSDGRDYRG